MNNSEVLASEVVVAVRTEDGEMVRVAPTATVEVVSAAPEVPEEPKDYWQEQGFLKEIARVCVDLEGEREKFLFTAEIRQIIETINNATRVEDFERYSNDQIHEMINTLRRRVPEVERQVNSFVGQLNRSRAVAVDSVDFI